MAHKQDVKVAPPDRLLPITRNEEYLWAILLELRKILKEIRRGG